MEIHTHTPQAVRRKARAQRYLHSGPNCASRQGVLVTKDAIRAIAQPDPELWTTLATTYWLQKGAVKLVSSTSESRSPSESSSKRAVVAKSLLGLCIHLPSSKDEIIQLHRSATEMTEQAPLKSILIPRDDASLAKPLDLHIGLPVLADVFTPLKDELAAMLPVLYSSNTYQFDIRDDQGGGLLRQWPDEMPEQARVATSIRIKHWTWWHVSSGSWKHTADETDITLLPSGFIKMIRQGGQLDPEACCCEVEDLVRIHSPGWRFNKPWKLIDFVLALRQKEEPLIEAVNKFVELIQWHDESFHEWRDSPSPCQLCGKQLHLLRSSLTE
ncbi:hypothetical protein Slin15195_G007920 [Septoria linicola]|uniref:Uncharacterized protein n=1 Tax=Septoria linicola TaxID=215465 RepID=A0A9Q9AJU6_9PEZI|nr:hypothetical protein Slin14017_G007930 [Septoria linicola]USW47473.1 hypothetical protein Slin15195_G007920 [Septoria linicola]